MASSSSRAELIEVGEGLAVGTGKSAGDDKTTSRAGRATAVRVLVWTSAVTGAVIVSPSSSQGVVGEGTSVGTGISVGECSSPEAAPELARAPDDPSIADSIATTGTAGLWRATTGISVGDGRSVGTGSSLGDCVAAEDETPIADEKA